VTRRYDAAGAVAGEVYTHDRYHRLVASHHEQNGNPFSFRTFAYNELHQLASQTFAVSREAPVTHTVTYRYDAQGQRTGWVAMENGRHTEVTRELDAEGNCTTLTWVTTDLNSGVSSTSRHVYQYQNGNLVSSISDAGTGAERRWTFEYYPGAENKLRAHEEVVGAFPGVGATPSRNLVKTATSVRPNHPETGPETSQYTYEYNAEGFPTRIISVRTHAGVTSTSEAVLAYDCE
jgi:YD repeat-containing protein